MAKTPTKPKDDPATYPALGRALMAVEKPGAGKAVLIGLAVIVVLLFLADLAYYKKTYLDVEKVFGFYALFGLATGLVAVIVAMAMRFLLKRPEDYYAPHSTDAEAYSEDGLEREAHDG